MQGPTACPLDFEWGGLAACQTLRKGCFVFEAAVSDAAFFSILAQLPMCIQYPVCHVGLPLVVWDTREMRQYVVRGLCGCKGAYFLKFCDNTCQNVELGAPLRPDPLMFRHHTLYSVFSVLM